MLLEFFNLKSQLSLRVYFLVCENRVIKPHYVLCKLIASTICILTLPVSAQQTNAISTKRGAAAAHPERLLVPDRDAQRGAGGAAGDEGRPGDGAGRHAHRHRGPLRVHQHREGLSSL